MKVFNTLGRQLQDFKPLKKGHVKLYTCGPTVYDHLHIGNWAAYIRWDTLARTLRLSDYEVNWAMNVTDVGHLTSDADEGDDKLEVGARREGKTAWQIADFYTEAFQHGLRELNISLQFDHLVRATKYIDEQIDLIKRLEAKGCTYKTSDGVYFDTAKIENYGKLTGQALNELKAGARVAVNPEKRQPTDFALWKFSPKDKKRDMEWDSPWGRGFPGWHLECSALAMKFLGETLDIHAGGIDHIPTHHTNEIAQSEAATGKTFANYWLHSGFYTVEGVKISKSLRNGFTLEDIKQHGFSLMAYRLMVLQSHYRGQADFSWDNLAAAQNRLRGLQSLADLRFQPLDNNPISEKYLTGLRETVLAKLQDDLNTPAALAELSVAESELLLKGIGHDTQKSFNDFVRWLDEVFGLRLSTSEDISRQQKELLKERQAARDAKDWDLADSLRQKLVNAGINVNDTPDGQIWNRL